MKKIVFFVLFISFTTSLYSQLDQAKNLINQYMKENLNDIGSYSPVLYSKLDSSFTSIEDFKPYKLALSNLLEARDKISFTKDISITTDVSDVIKKIENDMESYNGSNAGGRTRMAEILIELRDFDYWQKALFKSIKMFKPEFTGWKLIHSYRAKNTYGGLELYKVEFYFNESISKITMVSNTK